jgi:hypothetical protein
MKGIAAAIRADAGVNVTLLLPVSLSKSPGVVHLASGVPDRLLLLHFEAFCRRNGILQGHDLPVEPLEVS